MQPVIELRAAFDDPAEIAPLRHSQNDSLAVDGGREQAFDVRHRRDELSARLSREIAQSRRYLVHAA